MIVNTLNSSKRSNTEDKTTCFGNSNVDTNFSKEQYLVKKKKRRRRRMFLSNERNSWSKNILNWLEYTQIS